MIGRKPDKSRIEHALAVALAVLLCLTPPARACPLARVLAPDGSAPSPSRVENRPAPAVLLFDDSCRETGRVTFGTDPASRDLLDTFGAVLLLRTVSLPGVSGRKLAAIAAYPAGDGVIFQLRLLLRTHSAWRVLPTGPVLSRNEGGLFVGRLGHGEGSGIAAWQIVIGPGEAHVGPHRWILRRWRVTDRGARRLPDRLTARAAADPVQTARVWGVRYPDMTRAIAAFDKFR